MTYERRCPCGQAFTTRHPLYRYCRPACSRKYGRIAPKQSAAQRGYGRQHQLRRTALLPSAIGTPCPLCHRLMTNPNKMHLDHSQPKALGGHHGDRMICATCNCSRGAQLGNRLRSKRHAPVHSRDWGVTPYGHAV